MILHGVTPSGFYIPPPLLPGNYCTDPNEPKNARNLSSRALYTGSDLSDGYRTTNIHLITLSLKSLALN